MTHDLMEAIHMAYKQQRGNAMSDDNGDVRPVAERRQMAEYRCQQCGGPHLVDTSLPSAIWNQIADPSDFLCTWCIDERLVAAGLTCHEAEFYFVGTALMSKMYPEQLPRGDNGDAVESKALRAAREQLWNAMRKWIQAGNVPAYATLPAFRNYARVAADEAIAASHESTSGGDAVMALVAACIRSSDGSWCAKEDWAAVRAAVERAIRQTRIKTLLEALDTESYAELRMIWQRARDAELEESLERQRGGAG